MCRMPSRSNADMDVAMICVHAWQEHAWQGHAGWWRGESSPSLIFCYWLFRHGMRVTWAWTWQKADGNSCVQVCTMCRQQPEVLSNVHPPTVDASLSLLVCRPLNHAGSVRMGYYKRAAAHCVVSSSLSAVIAGLDDCQPRTAAC